MENKKNKYIYNMNGRVENEITLKKQTTKNKTMLSKYIYIKNGIYVYIESK